MGKKQKYILGIDPGLANTGWAIIQENDSKLEFIESGTIITKANEEISSRIKKIGESINDVLQRFNIDETSLEEVFVNKNNMSSLKLGHARGAIILSVANNNIPITEYSATHIKKAIVGTGRCSKDQINMMVRVLVPKASPKNEHEADAIAIAVTHANNSGYKNYLKNVS